MALQIRRGTNAQRTSITPVVGELLYTTDTKRLFVGDGTTAGGNAVDATTDIVNDTSPQLGGDLDVNGRKIISASNTDITLEPNGTGQVFLNTARTFLVRGTAPAGLTDAMMVVRQNHNSTDVNNVLFSRSRGTTTVPTPVTNGDDIVDMVFAGYDNSTYSPSVQITYSVDGAVTTGRVPGKVNFLIHDGLVSGASGLRSRLQINSAGQVSFDSIGELTLNNGIRVNANLQLNGQNDLRFADSDSSNWVAFQAPSSIGSNVTWTLPSTDGTVGQALTTNGSGVLTWATVGGGGGGGLVSRSSVSAATGVIADASTANIAIVGFKGYAIYKIQTSHAAWVRIYTDTASRTADASRAEGVDPSPGAGVIAEVITTGAQTILMSPAVFGFNNDTTPTTQIYLAVKNKSGGSATITTTLTIQQLEV
jgi:hypothetical protein